MSLGISTLSNIARESEGKWWSGAIHLASRRWAQWAVLEGAATLSMLEALPAANTVTAVIRFMGPQSPGVILT